MDAVCGEDAKKCCRCGTIKPKAEFYARRKSKDGLSHACRVCENARRKESARKSRLKKNEINFGLRQPAVVAVAPPGMKICTVCRGTKTTDQFYRSTRDGFTSVCKDCWPAKYRPKTPRLVLKTKQPGYERRAMLKKKYGMTDGDYNSLLESQGLACAICGSPPGNRSFHVDHDHDTGSIRGLLCSPCNTGIGLFGDSSRLLKSAIDYLGSPQLLVEPKRLVRSTIKKVKVCSIGTKQCSVCRIVKDVSEFGYRGHLESKVSDECKACANARSLLRKTGATVEIKQLMIERQCGACAICFKRFRSDKTTHVDHDHKTKWIRGVLCVSCNHGLGKFFDSPDLIDKAINYLHRRSSPMEAGSE